MPTCRDIITAALRQARIISPGETPEAEEIDDGLFCLQGMYESWVETGMFGRLADVYKTADYNGLEGEAVTIAGGNVTVASTFAEDGSTGTDRAPYDLSCIRVFDRDVSTYSTQVYDRFQWVSLTSLTLDAEAPLASRGRDGLAACLAERYVEQFGAGAISTSILRLANNFRMTISLKLGSTRPDRVVEYF